MNPTSFFAIGCFHFAPSVSVPAQFPVGQYVKQLRDFFDSIETIEGHHVDATDEDEILELTEQPITMDDGGFFPGEHILRVEFTVRIPQRIQTAILKRIWNQYEGIDGALPESFKVTTRYYYHGPVTVVESFGVSEQSLAGPSDAVIIVREYIKGKMEEYGEQLIFETVGPSPFHTDFFVVEDKSTESFVIDHKQLHGYDRVSFRVCPEIFQGRTSWILRTMGHHLSYFYSLARTRSQRMRAWYNIETKWSNAKEILDDTSFRSRVFGSLRRQTITEQLIRDIFDFRSVEVFERQQARSERRSLSGSGDCPSFLNQRIDESFEETFSRFPTAEILSLAAFYEQKKAKRSDRFALLYAAIAGGFVGSAATLLASSF